MSGWILSTVTQALNSQLLSGVTIRNVETFEKPPVWFTDGQITRNSALKFCEHTCSVVVVFFGVAFFSILISHLCSFFFLFFTNVNQDFPACSVAPVVRWIFCFFFLYREKLVCSHYCILRHLVLSAHLLFGFDESACIFVCLHVGTGAKNFVCRGDRLLI